MFFCLKNIYFYQFYLMIMHIFSSLLIPYSSFLSLILSSVVMTSFYILSKILHLKYKGLSNTRVVSINEKWFCKRWYCSAFFLNIHKVFKANIWQMIKLNLLKLSFVRNFNTKKCVKFSLTSFGTWK